MRILKLFKQRKLIFPDFRLWKGTFGNLNFLKLLDVLLYREMQGIETKVPLLAIAEAGGFKNGIFVWC